MAPESSTLWSPEALADIEKIWDFYARAAGIAVADRMLRDIARAVSILQTYPLSGRSRDEVRAGLRSVVAAPNLIFYRVAAHRLQVVRVLDGRRDIDDVFSGSGG